MLRRAAFFVLLFSCGGSQIESTAPRRQPARPVPLPPPEFPAAVAIDQCSDTSEGFDEWLISFRAHALTKGISEEVATRAFAEMAYDPGVIELDRAQRTHRPTFETFSASHVTPARIKRGKKLLVEHAALFGKIEARFGVPPEIIVALWGLETDFGAYQGHTRSLAALATLAYDCRRADRFRDELTSALRIVQRGDLAPRAMVGAWAGELGQTQFLPSSYEQFGVDFDEDGRIDLIGSVDDALASTASYLAGHGWHAHEGYGPGTPNLAVLESWNKSEVYRKTVMLMAARLAEKSGRPPRRD